MHETSSIPATAGTDALALTCAEIDLDALQHNVRRVRELAGDAGIVAVVKADAYGHGAVPIARTLASCGVERFAVATIPEGVQLRKAGVAGRILVLGSPLPETLPAYAAYDLDVVVSSDATADAVIDSGLHAIPLQVHVKIDTGMGRIGLRPEDAETTVRRLQHAAGVQVVALWTHFATADEPNNDFVERQLDLFRRTIRPFRDDVSFIHVANSGALLNYRHLLELDQQVLIRPGISLYGLSPSPESDQAYEAGLHPVMRVVSKVTQVHFLDEGASVSYSRRWRAETERHIGVVGAGYADGYPRLLTNRGTIGIRDRLLPIAGTVCMDMTMVDLGPSNEAASAEVGDEAVLFGAGGPSCFSVAREASTITYEIVCRVGRRVPRVYRAASHA